MAAAYDMGDLSGFTDAYTDALNEIIEQSAQGAASPAGRRLRAPSISVRLQAEAASESHRAGHRGMRFRGCS